MRSGLLVMVAASLALAGCCKKKPASEVLPEDRAGAPSPGKDGASRDGASRRGPDGLPVDIPRPSSTPPTLNEWNAVPWEITVTGSSALNCETKMVREWLRVSCRPKGGLVPIEVKSGPQNGLQAYVFNDSLKIASLVVQVVQGKSYSATFTFQEGRERWNQPLVVSWPSNAARPRIYFNPRT